MSNRLPRALFWMAWGIALMLLGLVLLTPWLDWQADGSTLQRMGKLFAHDKLVRRTSLACALGLVVTAYIFFQPDPANSSSSDDVEQDIAELEFDGVEEEDSSPISDEEE